MSTSIPTIFRGRLKRFAVASAVLIAGYAIILLELVRFCLKDDLFSYILIVPVIAGVLAARRRHDLEFRYVPAPGIAAGLGVAAAVLLALSFRPGESGALSFSVLSFVAAWIAVAVGTLGKQVMAGLAFPAAFLVFMTPLSPAAVEIVERGLQHASAEVAAWLFPLAGVPFYRTGLVFQLPDITLAVAPECSGIRSTLVLFITSLVAGHVILERGWQRAALAALVIPLGILRNAFRIVTIGWLCTNHGPEMIHSPIHHRGGPVFFVISLVPLFLLLLLFRRTAKAPAEASRRINRRKRRWPGGAVRRPHGPA